MDALTEAILTTLDRFQDALGLEGISVRVDALDTNLQRRVTFTHPAGAEVSSNIPGNFLAEVGLLPLRDLISGALQALLPAAVQVARSQMVDIIEHGE